MTFPQGNKANGCNGKCDFEMKRPQNGLTRLDKRTATKISLIKNVTKIIIIGLIA